MILPATDESIARAAAALAAGHLVGLPTETVYGLAANAWNAAAVARIFAAKSRPPSNPLIVHVANIDRLGDAIAWPPSRLIRQQLDRLVDLWPGPLSLVCPRGDRVAENVTAGLPTVAVRIPDHPLALRLLAACPFPLAAPSANRSCYISPTHADHVANAAELQPHVACVLDGGPATHGVESTILLLGESPRLLRPGSITAETLAERLRVEPVELMAGESLPEPQTPQWLAPGMMLVHYSPQTPLVLLADDSESRVALAEGSVSQALAGSRVGRIAFSRLSESEAARYALVETLSERGDLVEVAHHLFAALRRLDQAELDRIECDTCPSVGLGMAIMDRLRRAAAGMNAKASELDRG